MKRESILSFNGFSRNFSQIAAIENKVDLRNKVVQFQLKEKEIQKRKTLGLPKADSRSITVVPAFNARWKLVKLGGKRIGIVTNARGREPWKHLYNVGVDMPSSSKSFLPLPNYLNISENSLTPYNNFGTTLDKLTGFEHIPGGRQWRWQSLVIQIEKETENKLHLTKRYSIEREKMTDAILSRRFLHPYISGRLVRPFEKKERMDIEKRYFPGSAKFVDVNPDYYKYFPKPKGRNRVFQKCIKYCRKKHQLAAFKTEKSVSTQMMVHNKAEKTAFAEDLFWEMPHKAAELHNEVPVNSYYKPKKIVVTQQAETMGDLDSLNECPYGKARNADIDVWINSGIQIILTMVIGITSVFLYNTPGGLMQDRPSMKDIIAADARKKFIEGEELFGPSLAGTTPGGKNRKFDRSDVTVFFILGGPGAGKGTQCSKLVEEYGFKHLSAGDLLRHEQNRPESKYGELINSYIKDGLIVPMEVTISLLEKAIEESGSDKILIDGFPRKMDQAINFEDSVCQSTAVLYFSCTEEEMTKRLLARGETSGRVDDNMESIRKRFVTFKETSTPVIDAYRKIGRVHEISCMDTIDNVFVGVRLAVQSIFDKQENRKAAVREQTERKNLLQHYHDKLDEDIQAETIG